MDIQATHTIRRKQPIDRQPGADHVMPSTAPGGCCHCLPDDDRVTPATSRPMTTPRHGYQAGHAGYLHQQKAARRQPAMGHNTSSTAPGGLRAADRDVGTVCVHSPCALPCPPHDPTTAWIPGRTCRLPVPGGDSPLPARHGLHHALNRTRVPPCRRHVCPHFLRAVMSSPRPFHAIDTGKDMQATLAIRRLPTTSQSQATRRLQQAAAHGRLPDFVCVGQRIH